MTAFTPDEWNAIALSLRVAVTATLLSLPMAILAGYALARWTFPGKTLVNGVLHLPLVLPPVVTGYMLLLLFGRNGPAGRFLLDTFGVSFSFRWTGAALAAGVMGFPLMLRAIRLSFETVDRRLEAAAGTLGANPIWTFFLVTLPLATPGIVVGAILSFRKGLGRIWDHHRLWSSIFPAKRRRSPQPFIPTPRCQAEMRRPCGSQRYPSPLPSSPSWRPRP